MKRKRTTAVLLAVMVSAAGVFTCAAGEPGTEAVLEEEISEAADMAYADAADAAGAALALYLRSSGGEELASYLSSVDTEKLAEYLELFVVLTQNEDFQSLMDYQEVQELAEALIQKAAEFAVEDPQLAEKILVAMGVDEAYASSVLELIADHPEVLEEVGTLAASEEGRKFAQLLKEYLKSGELSVGALKLADVLRGIAQDE